MDLIKEVDGLKWSGNCNELNAAYSADGMNLIIFYSMVNCVKDTRVLQILLDVLLLLLGCIFQELRLICSVGELSAAAGIAGSYCEYVFSCEDETYDRLVLSISSEFLLRQHKNPVL